jgi:uncharacterized protein (TIGR03435 family)
MTRVVVVASLGVILGLSSYAAAQFADGPAFEVVSIKPSNPGAAGPLGEAALPILTPPVGGRFAASNVPLRHLIVLAYDVPDSRIDGAEDWYASRRFDIQAKATEPLAGLEAMRPLLKALLADRFQLKVHTEAREMPIYALVVARTDGQLGAKITPSAADCSNAEQELSEASARDPGTVMKRLQAGQGLPCAIMPVPTRAAGSAAMRANGALMTDLARFLTPATGRWVQDRTSLRGRYDWELTYDRALRPTTTQPSASSPPLATAAPSDSPSLMTALQEQLGVKLEPARGPVEFLVIDSAALPLAD